MVVLEKRPELGSVLGVGAEEIVGVRFASLFDSLQIIRHHRLERRVGIVLERRRQQVSAWIRWGTFGHPISIDGRRRLAGTSISFLSNEGFTPAQSRSPRGLLQD